MITLKQDFDLVLMMILFLVLWPVIGIIPLDHIQFYIIASVISVIYVVSIFEFFHRFYFSTDLIQ